MWGFILKFIQFEYFLFRWTFRLCRQRLRLYGAFHGDVDTINLLYFPFRKKRECSLIFCLLMCWVELHKLKLSSDFFRALNLRLTLNLTDQRICSRIQIYFFIFSWEFLSSNCVGHCFALASFESSRNLFDRL